MTDVRGDAVRALAALERDRPPYADFTRADLSGADLSGLRLSLTSLAYACLDGADLRGADLRHVDLTGASLVGARLDRSRFEAVSAGGARLTDAAVSGAFWEQVNLTGADLTNGDLRRTTLRGCRLESALLDGADLTLGSLAHTNCTRASFRAARLFRTNTADADFTLAEIVEARDFYQSRELVVEALRREVRDDDFDVMHMVGAASVSNWCYAEWRRYLRDRPALLDRGLEALGRYRASGAMEALRDGCDTDRRGAASGLAGSPTGPAWPAGRGRGGEAVSLPSWGKPN